MGYELTERELEVILAAAEHGTREAAGIALGITTQTVKNHLTSILNKTGTVSTLQAYHRLMGGRPLRRVVTETTIIEYEEDPE